MNVTFNNYQFAQTINFHFSHGKIDPKISLGLANLLELITINLYNIM